MPYSSARGAAPRIIVLHTGEGILNRFDMVRFLDNNPGASAHAASDADGAEGPLVPYDRAAWTAGPTANSIGLHIEMCAFAAMTREDWLSETDRNVWIPWLNKGAGGTRTIRRPMSMLRWTAQWTRSIAAMYNIPLTKLSASQVRNGQKGVCGHADTSAAFGETDHTDPGGAFPWDVFIALCQGTNPPQEEEMPFGVPNPVQWEPGTEKWGVLAVPPVGGSMSVGSSGEAWFHMRCPNRPVKVHGVWYVHHNGNLLKEIPEFELKHDTYWTEKLPDGCSQVSVKYTGEVPIGATLETRA